MTAAVLDDATLAQLRTEAARYRSRFIDPALFRDASAWLGRVSLDWLERVVDRRVPGRQHLGNDELWLAIQAFKIDEPRLRAAERAWQDEAQMFARIQGAANREEAQRAALAWQLLKEALPVPVAVWHNWTARHLDGYEQGSDHIVVLADLDAGRFHRRARDPLCCTPSRAHPLRYVEPNLGDERRMPDCKACLRHTRQLAGPPGTSPGDRFGRAGQPSNAGLAHAAELGARAAQSDFPQSSPLPGPGRATSASRRKPTAQTGTSRRGKAAGT